MAWTVVFKSKRICTFLRLSDDIHTNSKMWQKTYKLRWRAQVPRRPKSWRYGVESSPRSRGLENASVRLRTGLVPGAVALLVGDLIGVMVL